MSLKDTYQKINELPQPLQEALSSDDNAKIISDALSLAGGDNNKLDQINEIVGKILMREIAVNKFPQELQKLNLSPQSITIVNSIIQQKIFDPVKKYLKVIKKPTHSFVKTVPLPSRKVPQPTPLQQVPPRPISSQQVLLKQTLPEPSETTVSKPELKTTELKNFSVSPEYQKKNEQIKNKLLEAMKKRSAPPSIVKTMEEVSQEMSNFKNTRKTKEKVKHSLPKSTSNPIAPSQVVLGQGDQKFVSPKKDKNKANTPFILDVKLQENENKPKKNTPFQKRKPIKYSKFKPQNPFGNA